MSLRAGQLISSGAALLAAVAACAGAAATSRQVPAPAPELVQLNALRARLGLDPLRPDPVAQRVVARMARSDRADAPPDVLDSQPDCAVCETFFERGLAVDPKQLYRRLGGRRPIGFGLWRRGWSAATNLSVFFSAAAIVLDPRAGTFVAAPTRRGMLVVAVTADPEAPFRRAVRWPPGRIDPRKQLWAQVLLPPGTREEAHLYEDRGGRPVIVAHELAEARGLAGARLAAFGLNSTLAYAHAYRVGVRRVAMRLRTRAAPRAFLRRSWQFESMSPEDERLFLDIIRRTPPLLRSVLAGLDGAVRVVGGGLGCSVADACEKIEGDRATLGLGRIDPFVVLHEIGHVVFDLGLDEAGRKISLAALKRAGWRDACCINLSEAFADQLAYWALGRVPPGVDSYTDRMYLPRAGFARLLRENAAYRPLPVVGPLAR